MKILIIANARFAPGTSGGDAIYESFLEHWDCEIDTFEMRQIDFKPFWLCYAYRIVVSCFNSIRCSKRYDMVYSASDFLPDSLAGLIFKIKGSKWVAGFYLKAFRENKVHYYTQKIVRWLIDKYADMVIVTNPTMYNIFPNKKKTWINGGIYTEHSGLSDEPKIYDAVFSGRIHPSKGIDELLEIWHLVRKEDSKAKLAVIGDGDLGKEYIKNRLFSRYGRNNYNGVYLLGFLPNKERYDVFKKSKVVLYPTPLKYDHFSMSPVEAMSCGCPLICFDNPVNLSMNPSYAFQVKNNRMFANSIIMKDLDFTGQCIKSVINWAMQFDYKTQALRVFDDIRKELCLQ